MRTDPVVLVVEDEPALRRFLRTSLTTHGYRVVEAGSLREGLAMFTSHNPEVVLLDLGLPDGDGMALVQRVREFSRTPILVVSARGREDQKVDALDAGADDYLTKPFGVPELLARMRAARRHARPSEQPVVEVGALTVDLERRLVTVGGEEVHLTPTEYRLLAVLARHVGKVLTHRQILEEVWGPGHARHTHYVRVYMAELRKKLEPDPAMPRWLCSEPGVGYRLVDLET